MRPLTVRLRLFTPLAAPLRREAHPIHLDALLISTMAAEEDRVFDPEADDPYAPGTGRVPLAVVGQKEPIYQTSVALISGVVGEGVYSFTKRALDLEVQVARAKRPEQAVYETGSGAGLLKPWMEFPAVLAVSAIEFRCVGDAKEIRKLLDRVPFVGPFRRWGLGEVFDVEIREENDADPATWGLYDERGPVRELPIDDWLPAQGTWIKGAATVRSPYWYPGNTRLCWIPDPYRAAIPHIL